MDDSDSESSSIISSSPSPSPHSVGDYSDGPFAALSAAFRHADSLGWDATVLNDSDDSDDTPYSERSLQHELSPSPAAPQHVDGLGSVANISNDSDDSDDSRYSALSLQHELDSPPRLLPLPLELPDSPVYPAVDSQSSQSSQSSSSSSSSSPLSAESSQQLASSSDSASASLSASASASGSSPGFYFASSPEPASGSQRPRGARPSPRADRLIDRIRDNFRDDYHLPPLALDPPPRLSQDYGLPWAPAFGAPARRREPRAISPILFRDMERRRRQHMEDELVAMEVEGGLERHRVARRQARRVLSRDPTPRAVRVEPAVIDLTEEPDSPVEQHRPAPRPPLPPLRNPRRQMSQNHRTPSLSRSDGSILVEAPVIDLTEDSPEAPAAPHHPRRRTRDMPPRQHHPRSPPQEDHRGAPGEEPEIAIMGIFARLEELGGGPGRINRSINHLINMFPGNRGRNNPPVDFEVQVIGHHHRAPLAMDNPLQGNPVMFNYQANGWGNLRDVTPKPPHVPPTPAKEGYTRNTGEDVVVVCASCEEELTYDPDAAEDGPPAKRARTKKDREEHHFWALPACGHVYCRQCYENRANTGKKDKDKGETLHFRPEGKLLHCAVDDCTTDAKPKKSWVGIFL